MNQIQSIAAYTPYMTCPGNHEQLFNFSNYVNRFSMPSSDGKSIGGDNNHFFSINIGDYKVQNFILYSVYISTITIPYIINTLYSTKKIDVVLCL